MYFGKTIIIHQYLTFKVPKKKKKKNVTKNLHIQKFKTKSFVEAYHIENSILESKQCRSR